MEKKTNRPAMEQIERMDYLLAEMKRQSEEATPGYMKIYQEYDELEQAYDWLDEVFEENGKKGLKNVKSEVVVPAIYDRFGMLEPYYYASRAVGAQRDGAMALVARDGQGTPLTAFEYHLIMPLFMTPLYAVWKKDDLKHFALMVAGKVITPYEIENYYPSCNDATILEADGKMGMLYEPTLAYIKPEYDDIYCEGIGSDYTFVKDGVEGRITLDGRFISNDDFLSLPAEEQDDLEDAGFICVLDC